MYSWISVSSTSVFRTPWIYMYWSKVEVSTSVFISFILCSCVLTLNFKFYVDLIELEFIIKVWQYIFLFCLSGTSLQTRRNWCVWNKPKDRNMVCLIVELLDMNSWFQSDQFQMYKQHVTIFFLMKNKMHYGEELW